MVVLTKEIDPDFPFLMGQATAVIVEPKSADSNMTKPVGTGPYRLENWVKGSSISLVKWDGYRCVAVVEPGKVSVGHGGNGTAMHLSVQLLKLMARFLVIITVGSASFGNRKSRSATPRVTWR